MQRRTNRHYAMALGIVEHSRNGTQSIRTTTPQKSPYVPRSSIATLHSFSYTRTSLRFPPRPPQRPSKPLSTASPFSSLPLSTPTSDILMPPGMFRPRPSGSISILPISATPALALLSENNTKSDPSRLKSTSPPELNKKVGKPSWKRSMPIKLAPVATRALINHSPVPKKNISNPRWKRSKSMSSVPAPKNRSALAVSTGDRRGYTGTSFKDRRIVMKKTFEPYAAAAEVGKKDWYQKEAPDDRDILVDLKLLELTRLEMAKIDTEARRIMAILHTLIKEKEGGGNMDEDVATKKMASFRKAEIEYKWMENYLLEMEKSVRILVKRKPIYLDERKSEKAETFRKLLKEVPAKIESEKRMAGFRTRFAKTMVERCSDELKGKEGVKTDV